jgi:hypothetical protein
MLACNADTHKAMEHDTPDLPTMRTSANNHVIWLAADRTRPIYVHAHAYMRDDNAMPLHTRCYVPQKLPSITHNSFQLASAAHIAATRQVVASSTCWLEAQPSKLNMPCAPNVLTAVNLCQHQHLTATAAVLAVTASAAALLAAACLLSRFHKTASIDSWQGLKRHCCWLCC